MPQSRNLSNICAHRALYARQDQNRAAQQTALVRKNAHLPDWVEMRTFAHRWFSHSYTGLPHRRIELALRLHPVKVIFFGNADPALLTVRLVYWRGIRF